MKTSLIIFFLGIQSSFLENREERVEGYADTIQWVITEDKVWRVYTFAIDQDVRVHLVADDRDPSLDYASLARENTEKHYGDVLAGTLTLESDLGVDGIKAKLVEAGLDPNLNTAPSGLLFWSPDGTTYRTKSEP